MQDVTGNSIIETAPDVDLDIKSSKEYAATIIFNVMFSEFLGGEEE